MENKEFEEYKERNVFMEKENIKKILDERCFHSLSVGDQKVRSHVIYAII